LGGIFPPTYLDNTIMNKTLETIQEIKLVGIKTRTNNQNEMSGNNAKIGPCIESYFQSGQFTLIPHRKTPGITYCAYTDYVSDYKGDYTYFIGEEVSEIPEQLPEHLHALVVKPQTYAKFTTEQGQMPDVVIQAWQKIWELEENGSIGSKRNYAVDFELYDSRAQDPSRSVVDIYIGIHD